MIQPNTAMLLRLLSAILLPGMLAYAAPLTAAEDLRWDLATATLSPTLTTGTVAKVQGVVPLKDGAAFAVPADAFPDQRNFTVRVTLTVDALLDKSQNTFLNKQTTKDDGFDFSIVNLHDKPGNNRVDSSVNKILMSSWSALGSKGPEIGKPITFVLAVRQGLATFYLADRPLKTCLMEMLPNSEPMWVGRNSDPQAKHLPVTILELKVYGSGHKYVSPQEEKSTRRTVGGAGWAINAPKVIEHPEWPKVLIYGDSISGGYVPLLQEDFEQHQVYTFHFGGFIGGEVPEGALKQAAASFRYDAIVFNNGLHSLSWTPEAVSDAVVTLRMQKIARAFASGAPQAKRFYLATTPHTAPRPSPDQLVNALGDKNDVVIRLNTLSARVMREEGVEWINGYALLVNRLDLASGDKFHWQKPAYELLSQEVGKHLLPILKKTTP